MLFLEEGKNVREENNRNNDSYLRLFIVFYIGYILVIRIENVFVVKEFIFCWGGRYKIKKVEEIVINCVEVRI